MTFGFVIPVHASSEFTNNYWLENCKCIKKLYPNVDIKIIDDNSSHFIVPDDLNLDNIEIIKSEYPGRGELLPYYYFYKYKWFDVAVILHDSCFIQKEINTD